MPLAAGMQLWPDGNHRTAAIFAENVAERMGLEVIFDVETIGEMRRQSKAIIVARQQRPPRVAEKEFLDVAHPLRQFYWGFRHRFDLAEL